MDLSHIGEGVLSNLKHRLDAGRLQDPLSAHDVGELTALVGLSHHVARLILEAVLSERQTQPAPPALVWSGPAPLKAAKRDTAVALRRLFESAQHRVVLAGYAFHHTAEILAPLHTAMVERGVQVDVFLHIEIDDKDRPALETEEGQEMVLRKAIQRFLQKSWPGLPYPAIHYDPRPLTGEIYTSLHAKCVVVDDREALVTSANFTDRAQTRNVEVGALIADHRFARQLAAQWHNTLIEGLFKTAIL